MKQKHLLVSGIVIVVVAIIIMACGSGGGGGAASAPTGYFYSATDGVHGFELWRSDGKAAGTYMVLDACPDACSCISTT